VNRQAVAWMLSYFRPRTRRLVVFALGAAVNSLLVLPVLWLIRHAFDVIIPDGNVRGLIWLGLAVIVLRGLSSVLSLALRSHILHTVKGAITELRADLVAHMYGRARAWFARTDPALLQTRIVQDTERLDNLSNTVLHGMIPALIAALLALIVRPSWRS
jgi:ATP-binding cassette subfamily B protein